MTAVFRRRLPSPSEAAAILADLAAASYTYAEIGATAGELPDGYHHLDRSRMLGRGEATFDRAVDGLRQWRAHQGAGLTVYPQAPPLVPGTDVLSVARVGPFHALAACRIVHVVDEPMAFGFAYGTLPLHPQVGEESFMIERDSEGEVTFAVRAFSRPSHPIVRLGGPVSRLVQRRTVERYLRGLGHSVGRTG